MRSHKPDRRSVLTGLAVLPTAVAPMAQASSLPQPETKTTTGKPRHDPVLHETDHTRTYYRLARS
ncbi:hypothetical protein SAMN04490244_102412 [Tranquillimonas rosea]|uniref:Formate dehydrogenase region TAT target n=1 Tax=Tranquillimonas rosea TaxID=641238 RepID=A0A1H9RSM1_9RHOB|nr:hypothetical protein [Tranquillimonas rosea]SER75133.1 hypothetical protein SAMN04490244_102412 [Tranquillimonas rosea]